MFITENDAYASFFSANVDFCNIHTSVESTASLITSIQPSKVA